MNLLAADETEGRARSGPLSLGPFNFTARVGHRGLGFRTKNTIDSMEASWPSCHTFSTIFRSREENTNNAKTTSSPIGLD